MPVIHLQVCAGFCNRVRALVSGICLAEDLQLPLYIHWFPKSPDCKCDIRDVLDINSLPNFVKLATEDIYQPTMLKQRKEWDTYYAAWDKQSDIYLKSYCVFYKNTNWRLYLSQLRPSNFVSQLLVSRTASVPWASAIGVHIRRTDHKQAIQGSPLESFLKKMRENTEAFYVIATDDKNIRDQLQLEFGTRCVFPSLLLGRNTEEAMVNGVTDFFALTKCTEIWGSYSSSFSEISAWYGNKKLTIIK
jgi:hypothetical protein